MSRPRSQEHLRQEEMWKQGEDIHSVSTSESTGKRLDPKPIRTRQENEAHSLFARWFDLCMGALEKVQAYATSVGLSDSSISAKRTGERTVTRADFLSVLRHPITRPIILRLIVEYAGGGFELRANREPSLEEIEREQRRAVSKAKFAELLLELLDLMTTDAKEVK